MEDVIKTLLLFLIGVHVLQSVLVFIGQFRMPKAIQFSSWPKITVVVAARNEEKNIARTLDSLVAIDYPHDKLEIIIGDGNSEDRTAEIIEAYAKKHPFVKLLRVDQNRPIKGKANALHQAAEIAKGDYILITDADCLVQPTWAKETVKHFTAGVGLVCGITIPEAKGLFASLQTLDWCYILGTSSAVASLGYPIGGIGNNFNLRKEAYFETGGYEKIPFSITEDYTLFRAISNSRWKIAFPLKQETYNSTAPMESLRELYSQKQRWTLGGLDASPLQSIMAMLIFLVHLVTLVSFAFLPVWMPLAALLVKSFGDFLVVSATLLKLRKPKMLLTFPAFELYYYLYVLMVPFILIFDRKVTWKGVSYKVTSGRGKKSHG
ncbi:glycosyl transferase family 2 [Chloroherpeton thalassium ATCC 35110]|uniref:Glycosyl transferase family 2 n=1 Tax=Chloroherpeton thalassium (strain ATCC 35110 / GB-78) TaxID=517418 RepID=B3QUQ8_CHLT3|nr:glycosyltransferase [Chloroherpeton thalassium]ACF12964.1 glycosyl transferase family 2 [Chloroherpeton thalassium ATCC 35110]